MDSLATLDLVSRPAKDLCSLQRAVEVCKLSIKGKSETLGSDHPSTLPSMATLGIPSTTSQSFSLGGSTMRHADPRRPRFSKSRFSSSRRITITLRVTTMSSTPNLNLPRPMNLWAARRSENARRDSDTKTMLRSVDTAKSTSVGMQRLSIIDEEEVEDRAD